MLVPAVAVIQEELMLIILWCKKFLDSFGLVKILILILIKKFLLICLSYFKVIGIF